MASCQIQISFRLLCLRVTRWYSRGRIDLNWTGISILDLIALRLLAIRARAAGTVKRSLARRASLLALLKVLNHEYGDSHYWRPCILTEKVDHWSGSLGNEAYYWAYETWKNIRDLTSKSLKTIPSAFGNRLQASFQCAHNHSNRCSDCEYNSWGYETVDLECFSLSDVLSSSSSKFYYSQNCPHNKKFDRSLAKNNFSYNSMVWKILFQTNLMVTVTV